MVKVEVNLKLEVERVEDVGRVVSALKNRKEFDYVKVLDWKYKLKR